MAEKRGYTTAYQLRKALNVSPTLAAKLWKGEFEMIGLLTLDRLCRLLECQPDNLLYYVEDSKRVYSIKDANNSRDSDHRGRR